MLAGSIAAAALVVAGLFVLALSRTPPAWWRPIDARHPGTIEAARSIEAGVINAMHKRRDADPAFRPGPAQYRSALWRHELDAASASAWLIAKLPRWIDSRGLAWPADMAQIQVEFRDGLIEAGALLSGESGRRFVSAVLVPTVDEHGSLWLRARSVRVGRLPLPARWAIEGDLPEAAELLSKLAGEGPLLESAGIRLSDGRRVRLIGVHPRGGRLELTCATEKGL